MTRLLARGRIGERPSVVYPGLIEIVAEIVNTNFDDVVAWDQRGTRLFLAYSSGIIQWFDVSTIDAPVLEDTYNLGTSGLTGFIVHDDGPNDHFVIIASDEVFAVNISTLSSPVIDFQTGVLSDIAGGRDLHYDVSFPDPGPPFAFRNIAVSVPSGDRYTYLNVENINASLGGSAPSVQVTATDATNLAGVAESIQIDTHIMAATDNGITSMHMRLGEITPFEDTENNVNADGGLITGPGDINNLFFVKGSNNQLTYLTKGFGNGDINFDSSHTLPINADWKVRYQNNEGILLGYSPTDQSLFTVEGSNGTGDVPGTIYDLVTDTRVADAYKLIVPDSFSDYGYLFSTEVSGRLLVVKTNRVTAGY